MIYTFYMAKINVLQLTINIRHGSMRETTRKPTFS